MKIYDITGKALAEDSGESGAGIEPVIFCIGDSLTQGDIGRTTESNMNLTDKNYPYFLARRLKKTVGATVYNCGKCGTTAQTWYTGQFSIYKDAIQANPHCIVPIMFGANGGLNDSGEVAAATAETESCVGYYMKLIEDILSLTGGMAQIIIFGTTYVDAARQTAYVTNAENSQATCKAIAEKYNLPFFSCLAEAGVNAYNTAVLQYNDGLHMSETGYSRLGNYIASRILSVASWVYDTL